MVARSVGVWASGVRICQLEYSPVTAVLDPHRASTEEQVFHPPRLAAFSTCGIRERPTMPLASQEITTRLL
jgi:hypothetical protein